jgi:cytochrome c-type biogenesis protein CcmH/NrfG
MAVTWAKKAINLAPANSQFHDILGEVQSLGTLEYQEAAQAYRRSIELDPNNLLALVGGAALFGVPEDVVTLDEEIKWLEKAVN